MSPVMRWGVLIAWLVLTTWQTHVYAHIWQSDLALWAHAVRMAPTKPRPMVNLGVSLASVGLLEPAQAAFKQAAQLAEAPHVPWYDREMTQGAVTRNLARLTP